MQRFLPFLQWLPGYKKRFFTKDLIAGITVSIILIPQAMAYAMIAGLPPVYGLYAATIPIFVYAFLGTSRQVAVGPVAMDALLVATGLGAMAISSQEHYLAIAMVLTLMVGALQLAFGILRMGFLVNFLSKPVISGFTSAAAVIIIFSQVKHVLGVSIPHSNQFHILTGNALNAIREAHWPTIVVGILGIVVILLFKKWNEKIPSILIAVFLGILGVYLLRLDLQGVAIVGAVSKGLPSFTIPRFNISEIKELLPMAFTIAFIGYMEAISIGKSLEEKSREETIDPNQELVALGTANIAGSLFQGFPISASFSRSAVNNESGAKTPLSSIVAMTMVVLTLLFLTPVFYFLPMAVLASIIMVSVYQLIDISYPRMLWKHNKDEFFLLLFTFLITLFVGILEGILLGMLLSLLLMVYRSSKPHFAVLGKIKNTEYFKNVDRFGEDIEIRKDLLVVRFDSQLYFGNKGYFKRELFKYIDAKGPDLRGVLLNAEAINYMDSSATATMIQVIRELNSKNLKFFISGAIGPTRDVIFDSGILDVMPKEHFFIWMAEAVDYFDNAALHSTLQEKIAFQNKYNTNLN